MTTTQITKGAEPDLGVPSTGTATLVAFAAELLGTFMLTFSGTATVLAVHTLVPHHGNTIVDDIAISLAFALGIAAAIYCVAAISGAHINPAVTIGLATVRRFPWREVPVYLAAQFSGALLAALLNWLVFGDQARRILALGSTHPGPGKSWWIALVTELVLTLVLMVVVMATAVFEKAPGGSAQAGLSIGFWIGAAVFLALPVSGGSLNPARTLGPDIISLSFSCWWTYLVGPVVGAILGGLLWEHVLSKGDKHAVESAADSNPRTQSDLE